MRTIQHGGVLCLYLGLAVVAQFSAFFLRYDFMIPPAKMPVLAILIPTLLVVKGLAFFFTRLYRTQWQTAGISDVIQLLKANATASFTFTLAGLILASPNVPRSIYVLDFLLCFLLIAGARFSVRIAFDLVHSFRAATGSTPILIYGAGSAGITLLREMQSNRKLRLQVIGFIDDDPKKVKGILLGVPVLGKGRDLPKIVERAHSRGLDLSEVVLAMPSATGRAMREALANCRAAGLVCKTVPGLGELLTGSGLRTQMRNISVNDLLGREPIQLEERLIRVKLSGKSVLVTGGAGSIGSELCRQVANFRPVRLVIFDQAESDLFRIELELHQRHPELEIVPCVGDIRDKGLVDEVMRRNAISAVFHAAAYKHVPMMEANVVEALLNNVVGTWNVARAAKEHRADVFLMISTDKAVKPTNVMGASKRAAELVVKYIGDSTRTGIYLSVRFGNVLGSNGSVVPLFQQQIAAGGPVTVTHPDMRRYFMTIPEAVQLVLQASAMGKKSEIFVLNMGEPIRIVDLARNMIRLAGYEPDEDIEIRFTGPRAGEKMFEELMLEGEQIKPTYHEKIKIFQATDTTIVAMDNWIGELTRMVDSRQEGALIAHIAQIVPEYQPSASLACSARSVTMVVGV
jgi:FlaA1/EpsC-like NDP-sugar epimerase